MSYLQWIRQKVGSQKILLVFASACIYNDSGQLLWQRRSDFGWWGLPGGILELNESLPECIVREVQEETGLKVKPTQLIGVYSSPDFDVTYPNGDQVHQITFCFKCCITGGKLQSNNPETLDLSWFKPNLFLQTSPWYQAMAEDFTKNERTTSFIQGNLGNRHNNIPYYKFIRPYIGPAAYIMPSAAAFIQNKEGHILLQRRADNGEWEFPGGGMELGEHITQTVAYEVKEETGLKVKPTQLIGVYSDQNYWFSYPNGDKLKVANSFFRCQILGGNLRPDNTETIEVGFFSPDNLPPLAPRHLKRINNGLTKRKEAFF